ncbi:MAG TPA: hypothetical protein VN832_10625 [Stellaceae bacterium]|nr:hypothetical protein [Stellaceae bacterium]
MHRVEQDRRARPWRDPDESGGRAAGPAQEPSSPWDDPGVILAIVLAIALAANLLLLVLGMD